MAELPPNTIVTPIFRTMFPALFEPRGFEGQTPKYSVEALFENPDDLEAMKQLAKKVVAEKWPKQRPAKLHNPFRDGSEREYEDYQGGMFVRFSSTYEVRVVDQAKRPVVDPNRVYAGQYGRAVVTCRAFDTAGNRGVSFYLNVYQIVRDGDPIRPNLENYLPDDLPTTDYDPNEIPF